MADDTNTNTSASTPAPATPKAAEPTYPNTDVGMRAWFRANILWVRKELDLHTQGASMARRAGENPIVPKN